jgi:hypothetical protein
MDAYDRCTNLEKKYCWQCFHLWSRPRTFQTTHVSDTNPKLPKVKKIIKFGIPTIFTTGRSNTAVYTKFFAKNKCT